MMFVSSGSVSSGVSDKLQFVVTQRQAKACRTSKLTHFRPVTQWVEIVEEVTQIMSRATRRPLNLSHLTVRKADPVTALTSPKR